MLLSHHKNEANRCTLFQYISDLPLSNHLQSKSCKHFVNGKSLPLFRGSFVFLSPLPFCVLSMSTCVFVYLQAGLLPVRLHSCSSSPITQTFHTASAHRQSSAIKACFVSPACRQFVVKPSVVTTWLHVLSLCLCKPFCLSPVFLPELGPLLQWFSFTVVLSCLVFCQYSLPVHAIKTL